MDTSQLSEEQQKVYDQAIDKILETDRGEEIMIRLIVQSFTTYKIEMNNDGKNGYDPETKTVTWDPSIALMAGDDNAITPVVVLAHELGHAYQDDVSWGKLNQFLTLELEDQNVRMTENPIAKAFGNGIRKDYFDWKFEFRTDSIFSKRIISITRTNDEDNN